MTAIKTQQRQSVKHFCIFDYYLDGTFLRWEESLGECPVLFLGKEVVIDLDNGSSINTKIIDFEFISEDECHVYLGSC